MRGFVQLSTNSSAVSHASALIETLRSPWVLCEGHNSLIDSAIRRHAGHTGESLFIIRPSLRRRVLLLRLLAARDLGLLHLRLYLVQRITLPFPDPVHGQQVYLQVLLRLELLAAHVTGHVLRLHGVHVHDVLLQVRVVRVHFAALRALRFTGLATAVRLLAQLLVEATVGLLVEHRHAFDFVRARLKDQIELVFRRGGLLLLLQVLQLLMLNRELLGTEAAEGVEGVQGIEGVLLRRLAGGVEVVVVMVLLEERREILSLGVVSSARIGSRPGVVVPRGGHTRQPTGTRA